MVKIQRSNSEQNQYEGGTRKGPGSAANSSFQVSSQHPNKKKDLNKSSNSQNASRKKALKTKYKRYESNSVDEEEFQDYFVNPVKRKEFDMRRKRQQVKEMHNITQFTLGNFGIENKKALKDALPPYPETIETTTDQSKNYATVSLCCLSVTNPFRNKIIHLVTLNKWFDIFILTVITVNCIFLALDKEVEIVTQNSYMIDFVFLIIYTLEMVLKVIAQGFVMRPFSYLRDGWNILDFSVVCLGWLAISVEGADNISAIKVIRILRPLRTINQIPKMPSLVSTIMNSLPIMFDVMVLFLFMMLMFGTIATQLLGGHLEKRCTDLEGSISLGLAKEEIICRTDQDCIDKQPNFVNSTCLYYGNPIEGTYGFDNVLLSMLNIFQIITLEGWTDMMYIVRDVEKTFAYDLFFIMCVVLGSFVILNLMVAVQASYLDQAFDIEDQENKEREEKLKLKKEQLHNQNKIYDEDDDGENEYGDEDGEGEDGKKKEVKKCFNVIIPDWYLKLSEKMKGIVDSDDPENMTGKKFEKFIVIMILLNTFFMSIEHYNEPLWVTNTGVIANYIFTFLFAIEMIMKLSGFGFKRYFSEGFNIFDSFIVIMSFVELLSADSNSSLSVLRAFRLLRIFKIIRSWESLKKLLKTVLDSITAITNLAILIFLYLFISALLTKQFYPDELLDGDGNPSRYSFQSTGDSLVSVFIILTGENWNEIMVQVIAKYESFSSAPVFILIVILGNWMLLNLFLAILLKALSTDDSSDKEESKVEKDAKADTTNNQEEDEEYSNNQLDSSNSNIEQEFNKIKEELERITKGIFLDQPKSNQARSQSQGSIQNDMSIDSDMSQSLSSGSDDRERDKKISKMNKGKEAKDHNHGHGPGQNSDKKIKQDPILKVFDVDEHHHHEETLEEYKKQKSLFIFAYDNKIRAFLREFTHNNYFSGFIYHMIALNSLLLILDAPDLEDKYQKQTISNLLLLISIIFIFECTIKIIAHGFICGEKTFLKDGWNILDFIIVMFSIITMLLEGLMDTNVSFIRGFRALRALRPLKFVSKNEGIKTVVNALLESIPSLLNVMLIVLLFLLVFGILGVQLFQGKMGECNDSDNGIMWKKDCIGTFLIPQINPDNTLSYVRIDRVWDVPFNNYDNVINSMITFFEISTLEMWPGMMYRAIDSYDIDHGPIQDTNKGIAIVYIIYIFVTTFFIMNLFISVIVDKFNEEIKKRQGENNFSDEQKEWVKLQRLLVHTNPKIIPVEPINLFRLQCFKIVQSQAFEYIVLTAIVFNTAFMCMDHYGQSAETERIMQNSNTFFVIFFTIEMVLKLTAYGFKYYWYVNWNKFDFIVVILSLIAVDEEFLQNSLNFNPTSLRIIRITRLFRMVKTSQGLRTLLKTLFMSVQNIINTALLLFLILFTFAVAGMSLFANVPDGDFINQNVNFKSFYISFMTLWRAATGESWNGIMHDCFASEGVISVFFWCLFQLAAFFIFMNVFIAVIGESFDDNKATEDENDILALKKKDIKAFQNTWAKFNPMGELYMRTVRLPEFLRQLPPPLGYLGIRIEDTKLNKIIFCLNIRDHLGKVYYPEVMWAIFHSIAGMNDKNVLECQQIKNILKIVKMKYKGLGKGINLDQLCGNKYYRKELTAVKYIQAIKILTRWKAFNNHRKREKDTKAFENKLEDELVSSPKKNLMDQQRNNQPHNDQHQETIRETRVQNIQNYNKNQRDNDAKNEDSMGFSKRQDERFEQEMERTRKLDYNTRTNYGDDEEGINVGRNIQEESDDMEYRDDDMGGERNIMSARDPNYRNKHLQEQRSRSNQRNKQRR